MKAELKPCPFCGEAICFTWVGNSADSLEPMEGPMCKCGAQGPMYHTREQAMKAWNTRSDAAGFRAGIEAADKKLEEHATLLLAAADGMWSRAGKRRLDLKASAILEARNKIRALTPAAPEPSEADVERVARAISETRGCPKEIGQEVAGAWWWDKRHNDPRNEFAHESRKEDIRAARAAIAAMQVVLEPTEAEPDMFWSKREGLYPEETPLEDWRDELDGADPFTPVEIEVGKRMGSRWVVYIPTDDSDHWHDDCHMFATEADARAALAAMGRV